MNVHFQHVDLRDIYTMRAAIARIVDTLGAIQVLVNNAAHDDCHITAEVTREYWDDRSAVNLKHHFFGHRPYCPA